jgi:aminoglycoside phosphotransferase (APT) family kinase protein
MLAAEGQPGWFGWFAGVIPADARRFRVTDPELAAIVTAAGAEVVETAPDVEIVPMEDLRGDAPYAVVRLDPSFAEGNALLHRTATRVRAFVQTQAGAFRARRALRRCGYPSQVVVRWDLGQVLRRPGPRDPKYRPRIAERLPSGAVVVGCPSPEVRTVLDDVAERAAREVGEPFEPGWPTVRGSGVLLAVADRVVLKVAVGPARREIERHAAALDLLRAQPDEVVAARTPRMLARGQAGLAYWSLERRVAGTEPAALNDALVSDCLDFLVALHAVGGEQGSTVSLVTCAKIVGRFCRPDHRGALLALAGEREDDLASLPRGMCHGDFWRGNLLAENGRLSGVVDWSAAGTGRLPLLDLLNLLASAREPKHFGRALVEYLLPWARTGGDELSRAYFERLGLEVGPEGLEALVVAYWLERSARELDSYGDRARRPIWLLENIELVVPELSVADRMGVRP